jgi:hypothetical protein
VVLRRICYGLVREDWTIVLGNGVAAALSGTILFCKLRDVRSTAKISQVKPAASQRSRKILG